MATFNDVLSQVKQGIREVSVEETKARVLDDRTQGPAAGQLAPGQLAPVLVDIRERDEYEQGFIPTADWIPRGFLELKIEDLVPDREREIIVYCAGGTRSALGARSLTELGYTQVSSMAGGFRSWKNAGYPFERPRVLTPEQIKRYSRHIMLPEVGEVGQGKLLDAKVLLLGAGGLGSPSGLYLAAAGVGTIGIVDDDVVDESNLQRQVLHNVERLGMAKVESARKTLQALNPDVRVIPIQDRLDSSNVLEIISQYDLIVDGADNFQTRYLLNDASLKLRKPVVHASIFRFEGQLTTFMADPNEGGPCYRCLYPDPPPAGMAPSCQEAGVLGVLPGMIGTMQANEALKIILGVGETLSGRLMVFDALSTKWRTMKLRKDPECRVCSKHPDDIELIDYEAFCDVR